MQNIFKLLLVLIPVSFVLQLVITEQFFLKKGIKYGGYSPINKQLFIISKYSVLIIWLYAVYIKFGVYFNFTFHYRRASQHYIGRRKGIVKNLWEYL